LREMGAPPIRTGPVGSAHAMKALNNYVYAAGLLAAAEAVHMAAALGLDTAVFTDVLNASSGRNVATETKLKSDVLTERYAAGFQLGLMRKDLETAGAIAEETGFDAPSLALCRSLWTQAVARLGPRVDNLEIHRFLGGRERA
jgi:3-hydroxyisobutyrate dehydrogenase